MSTVTITGLSRISKPKPNRAGFTILAFFDCEAGGFALHGCALVRTPKDGLVAWAPKLDGPEGMRRSVAILDDSLRHAIMLHAREAYRALGGRDAEWIGRAIPMGPRGAPEENDDGNPVEGLQRFLAPSVA
jgi:hypothetical protein